MARRAAPVVEEPEDEGKDYTVYADKPITPKMQDFHEWLEEVTGLELDLRSVALGPTLYHDFQASDFNKERTEQRRAERASARTEPDEEAPAKPARRGRAARPVAVADEPEEAPAKPARAVRGRAAAKPAPKARAARGRGRAAVAADDEAPY